MARIAVGGLLHETNTFAPQPATLDLFLQADAWPELLRGPGMLERVRGINIALAGFAAAAAADGHELLPLVWANAGPSGPVTEEASLRRDFGDAYDRYRRDEAEPMPRRFSIARAWRNREYRAIVGLLVGFALLALKIGVNL